jgi:leucyl-tRNA synthetase
MDTFVDSSWYFLRYCSPSYENGPFDTDVVRRWNPVYLYVGGSEHAILHLMYSRFFIKVLHDMRMVDFDEPFTRLLNQGQVINHGRAMSKSLGNGVDLGEQLAAHGVDAIRLTMIFASPPADDIDWADVRPEASVKFLGRAWRIAAEAGAAPAPPVTDVPPVLPMSTGPAAGDRDLRKVTHHTIDEVTRLIESRRLNVAVARLMELATAARRAIDSGPGAADPAVREAAETLAVLLSLFAPYTAEECWELLGHEGSVATAGWPSADPALLVQDRVTCVVQVGGKVRDRLEVPPGIAEDELRSLALAAPGVSRALAGRGVRTVIVRAPKLVNVVPE